MAKRHRPAKVGNQRGYTLIELMIAAAVGGLVFYTLMGLLGQTMNFATLFHGSAGAIEASSDAISQLNAIMPQIVRVRRCSCSGSSNTSADSCVWTAPSSSTDPSIGKDPVQNFGIVAPGTELEVFAGDFESFGGNLPATGYSGLRGLYTGYLGGACESEVTSGVFTGVYAKGCKLPVSIYYTSPTLESGAVPSKSGQLRIVVGSGGTTTIGQPAKTGQNALIGLTQLSCGFARSTGSNASMLFVLNMKIKSRSTTEQNVSSYNYESWWPPVSGVNGGLSGKNYVRGTIRDLRFKFAFRNLTGRGMYQWRVQGNRNCKSNNQTVTDKSDCCSLAASGASAPYTCTVCKSSGTTVSSAGECCSEQVSGGQCI